MSKISINSSVNLKKQTQTFPLKTLSFEALEGVQQCGKAHDVFVAELAIERVTL
jgi:hypothetical protein